MSDYESGNDSNVPDYEYDDDVAIVKYDKKNGGF